MILVLQTSNPTPTPTPDPNPSPNPNPNPTPTPNPNQVFSSMGSEVSPSLVANLVRLADDDGNGTIEWPEFIRIFQVRGLGLGLGLSLGLG